MSNALYDTGRNSFARGDTLWKASGGSTIRVALVKAAYTPNLATDQFLSTIGVNYVGNSGTNARASCPQISLADPIAGVVRSSSATITLTAVPSSVGVCNYIVIFIDSGADATSQLLALLDTATGLPVTPNNGDITLTWDTGANGIWKL
jgi:hypothetical protein